MPVSPTIPELSCDRDGRSDRLEWVRGRYVYRSPHENSLHPIAREDTGAQNWIDIAGRTRGLLVCRWVWARDNPLPTAREVALSDVRAELPTVDAAERRTPLSRRREAVWNRFL